MPSSPVRKPMVLTAAALAVTALLSGMSSPSAVAVPSPSLVNRAVAAGINWESTPSWDLHTVDYDLDGDTDFSMSLHMKNAGELRRNNGDGTFTRVGFSANPATTIMPKPNAQGGLVDRHTCAWADFDHNSLPDAYCAAGRYMSNRYKTESINNELFLQNPGAPLTFTDVATVSGVGEPCTRGRHTVALDLNNDGWQDLFMGAQSERSDADDACNDETGPTGYPYNEQSKVFINCGTDTSCGSAAPPGDWRGFRFGTQWNVSQANTGQRLALPWDYNRDGRIDLLTLSFVNQAAFLYRNTGTGFQEVSRSGQVPLPRFNGASLADLTGDGILDLVFADNTGFAYRAGTATGVSTTTVRIGGSISSSGDGWGTAVGDINGDGQLDVYGLVAGTNNAGNPADFVYVRNGGSWVAHEVPPAGGDANDVVAITVNGRAQFVVTNGGDDEKSTPGPVQLIAWTP